MKFTGLKRLEKSNLSVKNLFLGGYDLFNHNLRTLSLFVTNRCNSKCKTCYIWKQKPKVDLPVKPIKKILDDPITKRSVIFLTGGEFFLHPEYEEILTLFENRKFNIFSNALCKEKLIKAVNEYEIQNLYLSWDGKPDTNKSIRGIDSYNSIIEVIDELKNKIQIIVNYTISPWNSFDDLIHVKSICEKNKVRLQLGIYSPIRFFNTNYKMNKIDENIIAISEEHYIKLYNDWFDKKISFPCNSLRIYGAVYPNGAVPLCPNKGIVLGNVNTHKLSDIWKSERSKNIRRKYYSCNDCWNSCNRKMEVELISLVRKKIPKYFLKSYQPLFEL